MSDSMRRLAEALKDRYRLDRKVGEGGMASVYLADDLRHGRRVALKVLRPELGAAIGAQRFLAEIRTTARLQHPHILPLFDSGEADGLLFYVLRRTGRLSVEEAEAIQDDVVETPADEVEPSPQTDVAVQGGGHRDATVLHRPNAVRSR